MAETSSRFALPYLQPGQAQKEAFHNEALTTIDALLHPVAQDAGDDTPPESPVIGQCWIVGDAPTGAWAGYAGSIAMWSAGGWRFIAPQDGMMLWLASDQVWARRSGSIWIIGDLPVNTISIAGLQILGARQPAIADPAGGAVVDTQARSTITALLAAMRAHGLIAT